MSMSIRDRIKAGKLFTDMGEGLPQERLRGKELMYEFNHTRPSEVEKRERLIREMFATVGENAWIEPPIYFSYGSNIHIGKNFYANFNFTIVDDYTVTIGDNVLIAPNVTITVTGHPVHHELRKSGEMFSFPVTLGNNVWIGSNVVINPGITIGDNSVIGAGSVVTKNIPPDVVAVGVPCRVIRNINERDREYYYQNYKVDPSI
ncbi:MULTISPECIES: galactoside O-acetyltransferase [Citrobacter]|jgi:galactoside O-acetyltransferase|uniref:Acetyltransferase n=1 Tax=Citrobacter europaeus TaxID=1914243 RepID=A0ABY0JV20_9ENTR|nr:MULTISPECIES: galactoside O-acetyltransferase [Citrobacter]APR30241.1 galactoside O-acetyltransferase [Citrobacter freundii]ARC41300.1 galactoside O-acetyltransferase [Citrobacter braakii]KDF20712.1 galactoside O-acetyltransferase [Citrobacter freundii MGH 56]AUT98358.1 galactoside O-acetyltransferase [Citrobacter freundii]MBJ8870389.1 galactoside O-acetyltransferase [Citrobacter braakii]